jgi:oligoendopeptidase F
MYPFYYISYSVSAVSALDIYFTYLEDEKTGKELYFDIVNSPDPYITACQNTGVKSFFDDGVIKTLAEKIENITLK